MPPLPHHSSSPTPLAPPTRRSSVQCIAATVEGDDGGNSDGDGGGSDDGSGSDDDRRMTAGTMRERSRAKRATQPRISPLPQRHIVHRDAQFSGPVRNQGGIGPLLHRWRRERERGRE